MLYTERRGRGEQQEGQGTESEEMKQEAGKRGGKTTRDGERAAGRDRDSER